MKQIIKRLEIIKSCIAIEDDETLKFQVEKLSTLDIDEEVKRIIKLINNTDFEKVLSLVDAYIKNFTSLVVYENKEIQGLKLELKILEKQFLFYNHMLEEYYASINDFNSNYNKVLGFLIQEVLILREEYFEFMSKHNMYYETQYEEAKKDFEEFHNEFKKFKFDTPKELSKKEKKELKRLYKKASKLCHPDIVEEDKKQKAELVFKELNAAYQKNDIKKISLILNQLLSGESFSVNPDKISDEKVLRQKISSTREKLNEIKLEVDVVKKHEVFILLNELDDINDYFIQKKNELLCEKEIILEKIKEARRSV